MRASGYDRAASDWYVEPAWIVGALLDVERFDGLCWDPSCGGGTIPKTLAERRIPYLASDIADRGYGTMGVDFFGDPRVVPNKRRDSLFQKTPLARVWVSSRRASMPPGGTGIPAKGGAIPYAWFVWEHRYSGPPVIGWL